MTANLVMGKMQGLKVTWSPGRRVQRASAWSLRSAHPPTPTLVPPLTQQPVAVLCCSFIAGLFLGSLNLLEEFGPFRESSLRERPTQQPPTPNVREGWAVEGPGSQ